MGNPVANSYSFLKGIPASLREDRVWLQANEICPRTQNEGCMRSQGQTMRNQTDFAAAGERKADGRSIRGIASLYRFNPLVYTLSSR